MRLPFILLLCAGFGQAQPSVTFEVATVKAAAPMGGGRVMIGVQGGPGSRDPGRITYSAMPLKFLLQNAYGVKGYQISGPAWLDTERYDITAKVPEGATKEQVSVMLQNLIVERFGLKFHKETKEFPLYELSAAKNGPKLKPAAAAPADAPEPPPVAGPPPMGKDGFPVLPTGRPTMLIMMRPGPRLQMRATMQPVKQLADFLGDQLHIPVIDKTGITGNYDFTLDFAPEPGQGPMGLPPPPPPPPGGNDGAVKAGDTNDQADAPTLLTAIQEQLGLKLDKKKGPLEVLVVDHIEKTPTEN
jgi:uncharacterized protein (TIGR03435 family)